MDVDELFAGYKGEKIALYGLGTETERVLKDFDRKYEITGLLDGFKETGELYGKPIISLENAVEGGVKLIIAVARPGSCRAIAKRIGSRCRECGISLMDIRGKDLLARMKVVYNFSNIFGATKEELKEKLQKADVVSFDLFDTLVMRQTLSSEDVVSHVEYKLRERGIFLKDFYKKRLESEKELSRNGAPALGEIYRDVIRKTGWTDTEDVTDSYLVKLEFETDLSLIIPRKEVCEIFQETVKAGKNVYIVSDTYYGKEQLIRILEQCGITGYTDILSSSDYGTGKLQNLYQVLKNREQGKTCIHIGDDIVADIESAGKYGFETCRLKSAADLLEDVGSLGAEDFIDSISDRLKTGMFIARIFNSPFQFGKDGGCITVSDIYDVGYLMCAPMISDFVIWFYGQTQKRHFQNIWFSARDGYLIRKMYACLAESNRQKDESVYFMTSRTAAIRAGMRSGDDIRYVDDMKFSGALEENLKQRFGIEADTLDSKDISADETGLMRYGKSIIKKAEEESGNYRIYIDSLNVRDGEVAFFDFVAKGTSQMYIQRLLPNHLKGFYFMQLGTEEMKDKALDISTFYGSDSGKPSAIFDDYYILETLLTAPHPSVAGFDGKGQPVYLPETRKERDIRCFERAQDGILDYFMTYIRLCPEKERGINRKLDETFLGLLHKVRITDEDFLNLVVEDPFFNRMTNITDVL